MSTEPNKLAVGLSEAVGRTIRIHRQVRGLSLDDMADRQGMSKSGWSRVETGDTEIRVSQLAKAASIFRVQAWQIVKEAEDLLNTVLVAGEESKG